MATEKLDAKPDAYTAAHQGKREDMSDKKAAAPKLIDAICHIRRCSEPARYNYVTTGHPNGDMAASYCHEHTTFTAGHWDESPTPYGITITGPIVEEGK